MTSPYEADRPTDDDALPLPVPTGRVRFETGPDGVETAIVEMMVPRRELAWQEREAEWLEASSHPSYWRQP